MAMYYKDHRKRQKQHFLKTGLDGFTEARALELLLFYAIPQRDVVGLAYALLEKYGNLSKLFKAPVHDLMEIQGVGEHTAILLKLIPEIYRLAKIADKEPVEQYLRTEEYGNLLLSYFESQRDESVYMLCLDSARKYLSCPLISHGSVNAAEVSIRKIIEEAFKSNATFVVLAHNHTSGIGTPSLEDELTTRRIRKALSAVDVELVDHIVVADGDFYSMKDSGFFNRE